MSSDTLKTNMTVNELISRCPETVEVFNRLGMDACCGGDVPLDEAALRDGVEFAFLMTELESAIEGAP